MLYLYDALYGIKEEITHTELEERLGTNDIDKYRDVPYQDRWYVIDEKTKRSQLQTYHSKIKPHKEKWMQIDNTDEIYYISNFGRILQIDSETFKCNYILCTSKISNSQNKENKPHSKETNAYRRRCVRLKCNGKMKEFTISRLVAKYFLPEKLAAKLDSRDYCVVHKNGLGYEDNVDNLSIEDKSAYLAQLNTKPKKTIKRVFYLFDSLYGVKEKTTLLELKTLFNMNSYYIDIVNKMIKEQIPYKNRWFVIDNNTKKVDLIKMQNSFTDETEVWRDIKGADLDYKVSSLGRLKQFSEEYPNGKLILATAKLLDPKKQFTKQPYSKEANKHRRRYVKILIDGKLKEVLVSRLVAENFLQESFSENFNINNYVVLHKNNILYCDNLNNIYMETKHYNIGKRPKYFGIKVGITCLETGKYKSYNSIYEASRKINYPISEINAVLERNKVNRVSKKYFITKIQEGNYNGANDIKK